jgi:hypothetical protein
MGRKTSQQRSVTFKLVHNSTTGERVLVMVPPKGKVKETVKKTVEQMANALPEFIVREEEIQDSFVPAVASDNPYEYDLDEEEEVSHPSTNHNNSNTSNLLHFDEEYDTNETEEEARERMRRTVDGMFPNDGYDYSVHMREPGDGVFIPANKYMQQPPQFVPKRVMEWEENRTDSIEGTKIGKRQSSAQTLNPAVPTTRVDLRTILVKGAHVMDDGLDPEIMAALNSDNEEEEEHNDRSKEQQEKNSEQEESAAEFFDNMIREMNQPGQTDENGVEYFVDEEFEEEEEEGEEFEDYFSEDEDVGSIDKQLHNRQYFSKDKIERLEAKKQLNDDFDYLMKSEYNDDDDDDNNSSEAEDSEEAIEINRSNMQTASQCLENDLLDDFINLPENKRNHIAFFTDMTYEEAVKTIADADLRRIAEKLPANEKLVTEETKRAVLKNEVSNEEIVKINLKRLENNPLLEISVEDEDSKEEYEYIEVNDEEEQKKWDCETILSTYSNLENHPKVISEPITLKALMNRQKKKKQIELSRKSGIPLNILPKKDKRENEEESVEEKEEEGEEIEMDMLTNKRPKNETKEEKALRKKMIKKIKQEKRQQKKDLKRAFKTEEKEQAKILTQQHVSRKVVVKY